MTKADAIKKVKDQSGKPGFKLVKRFKLTGEILMKRFSVICILLSIFTIVAYAEDVTVYDYSNGKYDYYDLQRRGRNIEVYDWKNHQYMDFELERNGDVYDWTNSKYYDVDMNRSGRGGTVYDYEENRYYDFEIER